jgi:choline monooxygenase
MRLNGHDIFNPDSYARVRLPVMQAETLPTWCYSSDEFYRAEVERIFMKVWNLIGRADQVPNKGDYFTLDIYGVPLIILRDDAGRVRAFGNSCRHRGTRLLSGKGSAKDITCPYHSWAYSLDGKLLGAPEMKQTESFDKAAYSLYEIRLESWGGFLFINFDENASSLLEYLGDLPRLMESYRLEDMVTTRIKEYDVGCNWKIHVENAMEAYHVPFVHKASIFQQRREPKPPEPSGGQYCALYTKHLPGQGSRAIMPGDKGFDHIASLSGKPAEGTYFILLYPTTMLGLTLDCMWYVEVRPEGPKRCKVIVGSCFPRATAERPDFDEIVQAYYRRWDKSIPEDNDISEVQQHGVDSPLVKPGRFSHMEPLVHTIDNWVLDRFFAAEA